MLNLEQVLEIVPVSRSNLFKMMKEGNFPPGVFISPNRRVWYEDVVVGWQVDLEQRPTRRRRRSKRVSSQV
jgi:predicted DNA-binding transcriptional regulator AlpA